MLGAAEPLGIGTIMAETDHRGEEFGLDPDWLTRSCVIVGKSGTGKSYDIDVPADQLGRQGRAVVILDRTGEHAEALTGLDFGRVLTPGRDLFLPLLKPSDPSIEDIDEAVEDMLDTLAHYFTVSYLDTPS